MRRLLPVYSLFCILVGLTLFSCSTDVVPSRPVGNLSAEQLKAMVDRRVRLVLVDTRTEYEFGKGRIPGSVNIPPHKFDIIAALLPSDKNTRLVFYCRGSG